MSKTSDDSLFVSGSCCPTRYLRRECRTMELFPAPSPPQLGTTLVDERTRVLNLNMIEILVSRNTMSAFMLLKDQTADI